MKRKRLLLAGLICIVGLQSMPVLAEEEVVTEEIGAAEDGALAVALDATLKNGVDFACVIDENNEVYWELGVSTTSTWAADVAAEGLDYVRVEVLPESIGDDDHPYLYPDEREWTIYVIAEEYPEWFTDESSAAITSAFEEWKEEAYALIDLDVLFSFETPIGFDVAEEDVTEEIQNYLDAWAETDNHWMTCYVRNAVPTTVQAAIGMSIELDAWNYIYNQVWTQGGENLAGHSQVDLIAAFIGSAFNIDTWEGYFGTDTDYPFTAGAALLKAGFLYTESGGNLYSAKEINDLTEEGVEKADIGTTAAILGTANVSDTGDAFAVVVDEELNVYWKLGMDYCDSLLTEYGLAAEDVVQINLNADDYFTASSEELTPVILGDTPEWYSENEEAIIDLVRDAFDAWQEELVAKVDVDGLVNCLSALKEYDPYEMDQTAFDLLKEWVQIWNEAGVAGNTNISVQKIGYDTVGATIWNKMDAQVLANYKAKNHEGCQGPTTSRKIGEYALETYGKEIDSATEDYMGSTMNDGYTSLVGKYVNDFLLNEDGEYMYSAGAELWELGCIPFYDGEYWYLVSGPDYDEDGEFAVEVIYSASNDELLDPDFTFAG
ncbi:MAG: hypothetical protein LUI13_11965 [Lachnospiraceae bacterium]|nr:hypothetical protein [Lachnospiraceae bacterium]